MKPNKNKKAVAIQYDPNKIAPQVVAKGKGFLAEKMLQETQSCHIPVYQDAALVEELSQMDLGQTIPPELYEVVAQILLFISDLDRLEQYRKHEKQP